MDDDQVISVLSTVEEYMNLRKDLANTLKKVFL